MSKPVGWVTSAPTAVGEDGGSRQVEACEAAVREQHVEATACTQGSSLPQCPSTQAPDESGLQ